MNLLYLVWQDPGKTRYEYTDASGLTTESGEVNYESFRYASEGLRKDIALIIFGGDGKSLFLNPAVVAETELLTPFPVDQLLERPMPLVQEEPEEPEEVPMPERSENEVEKVIKGFTDRVESIQVSKDILSKEISQLRGKREELDEIEKILAVAITALLATQDVA